MRVAAALLARGWRCCLVGCIKSCLEGFESDVGYCAIANKPHVEKWNEASESPPSLFPANPSAPHSVFSPIIAPGPSLQPREAASAQSYERNPGAPGALRHPSAACQTLPGQHQAAGSRPALGAPPDGAPPRASQRAEQVVRRGDVWDVIRPCSALPHPAACVCSCLRPYRAFPSSL